jgi:hypothetical protein
MAFDGGGSAVLAVEGKVVTRPSDRFDVRHLPRERLVPVGWVVRNPSVSSCLSSIEMEIR